IPWNTIMATIRRDASVDSVVICDQDVTCNYYVERYGMTPYSLRNWNKLAQQPHHDVWWIQSDLSFGQTLRDDQTAILKKIAQKYRTKQVLNYAPQDPSIR